jgi:4-amino-4-deoxy-L-arabinose transferase-like glycosyltransferase
MASACRWELRFLSSPRKFNIFFRIISMEEKTIRWLNKANEQLGRFFDWLEKRSKTTLLLFFLISLAVRLISTNFASLLQKDAFVYLLQALDMVHGNFVPSASQSVGLSLFSAPFFLVFGNASIFHDMVVARALSCIFGSLIILPLYLLAKELIDKRARILVLVLFAFFSTLVFNASQFLTETLFTFFFLFALYYIVLYIKRRKDAAAAVPPAKLFSRLNSPLYLSFLFAGLAYYCRPNGIFILAVLVITYLIIGWKDLKKLIIPLLIGFLIFWAVSAPFLVQRAVVFGSPFTYGANDKYWVDDYSQVWSSNYPGPTALQYFRSHTPKQMFDRFIVKGAVRLAYDLFRPKDLPLLLFFFLIGAGLNIFKKEYWPLYISLLVFWAGLSLIYYIFYTARYCLPLFPILIVFMAAGFYEIIKNHKFKDTIVAVFIVCYVFLSLIAIHKALEPTQTMPDWAVWTAQNIRGRISVMNGGDFIIMNLPDATTAGVGQKDIYAPKTGLSVFKPGYFIDLPQAMAYFKATGVTHILYDPNSLSMHWYLREMPEHPSWFKEVYASDTSTDPWPVTIYQIQWDKYNQSLDSDKS